MDNVEAFKEMKQQRRCDVIGKVADYSKFGAFSENMRRADGGFENVLLQN